MSNSLKIKPDGPYFWVKGIKHGYCSCGREVIETDQTCPLCKNTLFWSDKDVKKEEKR